METIFCILFIILAICNIIWFAISVSFIITNKKEYPKVLPSSGLLIVFGISSFIMTTFIPAYILGNFTINKIKKEIKYIPVTEQLYKQAK